MDSSDVDSALMSLLANDAELLALMPGGVFFGLADADDRFVVVLHIETSDDYVQPGHIGTENFLYYIRATMRGKSSTDVRKAAKRIFDLLHNNTLTAVGYHPSMCMRRTKFIRPAPELDEVTNIRWNTRGGYYEVRVNPQPSQ